MLYISKVQFNKLYNSYVEHFLWKHVLHEIIQTLAKILMDSVKILTDCLNVKLSIYWTLLVRNLTNCFLYVNWPEFSEFDVKIWFWNLFGRCPWHHNLPFIISHEFYAVYKCHVVTTFVQFIKPYNSYVEHFLWKLDLRLKTQSLTCFIIDKKT